MPASPLVDRLWSELLRTATSHRIVGLLAAAVRSGALPTSPAQREALAPAVDEWMTSGLLLERFAIEVHGALRDGGVDHRFVKGLALAHGWYPDVGDRVFGDIDVVVSSPQIGRAIEVLERRVGPRMEPELNRGFDAEFGKGATMKSADGLEIDVHRTLVWGALGLTVDSNDLFEDEIEFEVGGVTLSGLGPAATFLHSCYSAVLGDIPPRLSSLRDVAETLPDDESTVEGAIAVAARWRASLVMAIAVRRMCDALRPTGSHPLFEWARRYQPVGAERALVHAHLMPGGTYARRVAAIAVVPGAGAKWRYARATAWPSREYLDSRNFSWSTHVKRSVRFADPRRRTGA
jgi:hypothetical protein